jgi:hypothetical protein
VVGGIFAANVSFGSVFVGSGAGVGGAGTGAGSCPAIAGVVFGGSTAAVGGVVSAGTLRREAHTR